jgi:hypothetical protein
MAKAKKSAKLKVFRTPAGFHDAYVAAPSQKAALKAWGSDADLFARGVAEVVTDEALTAEPLAKPGIVIKRSRGSAEEQLAEASKQSAPSPRRTSKSTESPPPPAKPKRKRKPRPRPSREALNDAEAAIADAEERQRKEEKAISQRIATLTRQRDELRRKNETELAKLEQKRDKARAAYDLAVAKWEP